MRFSIPGVLLILSVISGCRGPVEVEPPRNVVLIVVDTMRGDHMSCASGPVSTPNLDALAAQGVRFTQARSTAPITGPSHASLFTGLDVPEHGVTNNAQVLDERFTTVAEIARDHGLATQAVLSLGVLRATFGFGQGFETYELSLDGRWWRTAGEVNDVVLPLLRARSDEEGRFLFVHYSDPHAPYGAPGRYTPEVEIRASARGEWRTATADAHVQTIDVDFGNGEGVFEVRMADEDRPESRGLLFHTLKLPEGASVLPAAGVRQRRGGERPVFRLNPPAKLEFTAGEGSGASSELEYILRRNLSNSESRVEYRAEVEYVDEQIGRLLAELKQNGLWEDSVIIFTADHGEGMGDHDHVGHIHQLYDSLLHVPLIVVAPGRVPPGTVVDEPVSLLDLLPTLADLMAWSLPESELPGRSLVPLLIGEPAGPAPPLLAVTARPQARRDLVAVVDGGFKLIRHQETGLVELYDLGADPGELEDLAEVRPEVVERLAILLDVMTDRGVEAGAWADLDDESRAQLEALGYVH